MLNSQVVVPSPSMAFNPQGQVLTLLGDSCIDVYLNADFWSVIPSNVWTYTLGGYQVLEVA